MKKLSTVLATTRKCWMSANCKPRKFISVYLSLNRIDLGTTFFQLRDDAEDTLCSELDYAESCWTRTQEWYGYRSQSPASNLKTSWARFLDSEFQYLHPPRRWVHHRSQKNCPRRRVLSHPLLESIVEQLNIFLPIPVRDHSIFLSMVECSSLLNLSRQIHNHKLVDMDLRCKWILGHQVGLKLWTL